MSNRTPIIAGNWKMHKTTSEAENYINELLDLVEGARGVEAVICPPFTCLEIVKKLTKTSNIKVAAQNMHFEKQGAFTGEISSAMLTEIGVDDVILGHSERRQYFAENDTDLAKKVVAALTAGLRPILCVGETDVERESGETKKKIRNQIETDLSSITSGQLPQIVIAYEPIWAIGTGKTATPQIAQETNSFIRETLANRFGAEAASRVRILYGGSVKPDNINELMAEKDIDGGLVGGACLSASEFAQIVNFS